MQFSGKNLFSIIGNIPFLKKHPILLNIVGWLIACTIISICIGSASALFLESLKWATNFREGNLWIIALLPIAGLVIGGFFHYWGKDIEAGNNLIIENIHNPKKIIKFKMAPFILVGTVLTHLFGGSAGREGTAIQMGGSIADQFTKIFRLNPRNRQQIMAAAGRGMAMKKEADIRSHA